jgi:hypothetical protein
MTRPPDDSPGCAWCDEPFRVGDQIRSIPSDPSLGGLQLFHLECLTRMTAGSVGHQNKRCHCFGGTEEDPEGMSKREAAIAAHALFTCRRN